jgi:hypothetical protein
MVDLKLQVPATDKIEADAETLAAIDRGIKDADEGRTVSIDEVHEMMLQWISKFELQKPERPSSDWPWNKWPETFIDSCLRHKDHTILNALYC